ncbi:MAG TPA: HEAT repeat domain-containing protein [Verrucomicrobiae bacterium]|nr:HEAT repeat domain-containing protein [Verrucomicrobiae bacterium]
MEKRKIHILLAVVAVGVVLALAWLYLQPGKRPFHGKTEDAWLDGIAYFGDDAQLKQWRDFGPDGIRILARGLNRGNELRNRVYKKIWELSPEFVRLRIKKPVDLSSTRMCAASLLCQLGTNAKPALPAIELSLKHESRLSCRAIVIDCAERLIPDLTDNEKSDLLPFFLKGLKSGDDSERNNSAAALGHYPGHPEVVQELIAALNDRWPHVRLIAAESLNQVDSVAADKAGVVQTLIGLLKSHDTLQSDMGAARQLGVIGRHPELAVPALIQLAQGTDEQVGTAAVQALAHFKTESATIVPVLTNLCHDKSNLKRGWARAVLKQMDPDAAAKAGVK